MITTEPYNIIVILGPTAAGKTRLAAHVADFLKTEIISADSRQVYKDMNIGTGKDLKEYTVNGNQIPFHLIDIIDAGSNYNLNNYINDFKTAFEKIIAKNKIPILCGGTGLYIDAILNGFEYTGVPLNQELRNNLQTKTLTELQQIFLQLPPTTFHNIADLSTHKRMIRGIEIAKWLIENKDETQSTLPKLKPVVFGLTGQLEIRRKRIAQRLKQRMDNGLIEEAKTLLKKGVSAEQLIFYGLEYKFVIQYLQKEMDYNYLVEHLTIAIQQFAKRQMTYFRKMEKDGLKINWINSESDLESQVDFIKKHL